MSDKFLQHRQLGYTCLTGNGVEIGAMHNPADIPSTCSIEYCDAHTKEQSINLFPELLNETFVDVDYVCDLDTHGLQILPSHEFDFAIMNHVIEHVANPIYIVGELFRVVKPKGFVVLSAPDKNYIFDRHRALTSFEHLLAEYEDDVHEVSDSHYLGFIHGVHPEIVEQGHEAIQRMLLSVRERKEHPHVWDAQSFDDFLHRTMELLRINAMCVYLSNSDTNKLEYFSVWQKY